MGPIRYTRVRAKHAGAAIPGSAVEVNITFAVVRPLAVIEIRFGDRERINRPCVVGDGRVVYYLERILTPMQ